jgi:starch synthase
MEMRIACLSTDSGAPYGGRESASVRMGEMVDALAGEGARVLALMPSLARDATQPARGVTVETLPWPGRVASVGERLAAERERERWIDARLERFGAEALYERLGGGSAAGSRAAARLGIPHLVDLDAPPKAEARRFRGLDEPDGAARLEREVLARAERVLAASGPLATYALRCGASRVDVLRDAVALHRHPRRRRRDGERPVAVFAGRVRPWHGIETLAAAWRLLGEAAPALVVAGDAGEAADLLEGVGAVLLGPIPHRQVPAVLAEADIGLAPYAREAPDHLSPLKLFEYMGAGLATVTAELPATCVLTAEENAVIVPRGDAEALAAAVAGLAVDSQRRHRIGKAARALVADAHTWRHRARRVLEHASGRVERAPRLERSPLPPDPALPQMRQVLDTDVMAEVLARSLGDDTEPPDVRVSDLRYRPETNLLVHYDVCIGGTRHHATAMIGESDLADRARTNESQALADMVNGRSPAERALSFEPSLGALVQWLPLDLSLWALAVPPAHRDRRLRAAGVHTKNRGQEPALLGYRPQTRAVVRLNGHVLKYYASHASFGAAVAGLEVGDAAPVRAPAFEGSIPELLVTVQSHAPGREIASPAEAAEEAGDGLARLHAESHATLRQWTQGEQLHSAAESARLAGRIAPALQPRVERLMRKLEESAPAGLAPVAAHGDFHTGRLLGTPGGLVITDFDAMCAAPAALDVATYAAHMVRGDEEDLDAALAAQELILEGYGKRPEGLSWYLATAILRRSANPFQQQDGDWPERTEGIVAAAERAYA